MKNKKDIVFFAGTVDLALLRLQIDSLLKLLNRADIDKRTKANIAGAVHLLDCVIDKGELTDLDKQLLQIKGVKT